MSNNGTEPMGVQPALAGVAAPGFKTVTRPRILALALLGCVWFAAPAGAATIAVTADRVTVSGEGGEANEVSLHQEGSAIRINDLDAGITDWPAACETDDETTAVLCPARSVLEVDLGEGDDGVIVGELPGHVALEVYGGGGSDQLGPVSGGVPTGASRLLDGGAGNDKVGGSDFEDTLRGGPGDDEVKGWGGADVVEGGDGDDQLSGDAADDVEKTTRSAGDHVDGGPGTDTFQDYEQNDHAVTVSFDGQANDGRSGENDNLIGIEVLISWRGGEFRGSDGADQIYLYGDKTVSTVFGGAGDDILEGVNSSSETMDGGQGDDTLEGGYGDDVLTGGPGRDTILGDDRDALCATFGGCSVPQGNDVIHARDGEVDLIDCGVGADTAHVDSDDVAVNCENVETAATGPNDPGDPGAQACAKTPKVKGLKLKKARKRAKKAGCTVKVRRVRSNRVKKGRVVRAKRKGTRVTLHVSKGK